MPRLSAALDERDACHSAAVLVGMTSPATGAMVAAATTGIPERAKQGRDYDYRYSWIRDQTYSGMAAYAAGIDGLGDSAVRFVTERLLADGSGLMPAYTVRGQPIPREGALDLPGFPGGRGVRGNPVRDQHQLDVFGEALGLYAAGAERDRIDDDALAAAAELADRILDHMLDTCRTPDGAFMRAADDERPDAALVIANVRGALPWDHPAARATLAKVQRELSVEGYVYRFAPDERPLGESEGSFLLCSFWLALAEAQAGQTTRALRRLERSLASCGTAALFSEEFDVAERQLRGNLPQAFVHALALEACVRIPQQVPGTRDDGF